MNIEDKGRRLLTEGRLSIERAERGPDGVLLFVIAKCRGDSGEEYDLGFHPRERRWGCTCQARGRCSHLVALQLVIVKKTTPRRPA